MIESIVQSREYASLPDALALGLQSKPADLWAPTLREAGCLAAAVRCYLSTMDVIDACRVTASFAKDQTASGISDDETAVLALMSVWVESQSDETRRVLLGAAEKMNYDGVIALVAGAIGLTGSLAPAGEDTPILAGGQAVTDLLMGALALTTDPASSWAAFLDHLDMASVN